MAAVDARIAVTILTGFLGSGKTTLLNRLVRDPAYADAVVVINEYGEIPVDHHLVRHADGRLVLLEGGCMCCVASGGVADTLRDLFMQALRRRIRPFRRVLVETSGLADPAPIMFTLRHDAFLAERYRYAGAVAVADVRRVGRQLAEQPESLRQIALADVVALSKRDLAGPDDQEKAARELAAVNPLAPVCVLDVAQPLDARLLAPDILARPVEAERWLGAYTAGALKKPHPDLSVVALALLRPISRGAFWAAMGAVQSRYGAALLRVKGLVCFAGDAAPCAVHGVHNELYPLDPLPAWPSDDHVSRLLFIVRGAAFGEVDAFVRQALHQDVS